jgi:hypothetical protein
MASGGGRKADFSAALLTKARAASVEMTVSGLGEDSNSKDVLVG